MVGQAVTDDNYVGYKARFCKVRDILRKTRIICVFDRVKLFQEFAPRTDLWISLASVIEVPSRDSLPDPVIVLASRQHVVLEPVHDAHQLLAHVLGTTHRPGLDR